MNLVEFLYSKYLELILTSTFGRQKNVFNLLAILAEIQRKSYIYGNAGTLEFA